MSTTSEQKTYCVFNQTGESFVALRVHRADTPLARLRGVLGQFRMKCDTGLWVTPSHGMHMVGLLAPIDLIYLDAQNRVVHVVEHLRPFSIAPIRLNSSSVLQVPPHTIYSSRTHLGDQLLICRPEEMDTYLNNAGPVLGRQSDAKGASC